MKKNCYHFFLEGTKILEDEDLSTEEKCMYVQQGENLQQVFLYMGHNVKQGNSVARDLPRTGSETNTTIFVIYIYWI